MKRFFIIFLAACLFASNSFSQNVGIGTATPTEKLQVVGNIKGDTSKLNALQMSNGAALGKILTTDAIGNGTWQPNAGIIKALNGLTKTNDSIKLGGLIFENTLVRLNANALQITDTGTAVSLSVSQTNIPLTIALSNTATTQSFTAVNSGNLSSVEIYIAALGGSAISVTVKDNAGNTLGTITNSYVAVFNNWSSFSFSNILLSSGQTYSLSVTSSSNPQLYYDNTNPYSFGTSNISTTADISFKIFSAGEKSLLTLKAGKMGINNANPGANLDINGTIKINDGTNGNGKVLTSDAAGNASWQEVTAGPLAAWGINGNAGATTPHFLGTTDSVPLLFKINNQNAGYLGLGGNTFLGLKSGNINTAGNGNVGIGSRVLSKTTANYPSTAIGFSSQDSALTGYANTSLGSYSLTKNTQGINNTAIGNGAMYLAENTATPANVYDNTAVGDNALYQTHYYGQTAVGAGTLSQDTGGIYNTAIGYLAMYLHQRGNSNTALGTSALRNDTTGNLNTALGTNAMMNHKSGDNNIAVGYASMSDNIIGANNISVGNSALFYNNRSKNIAMGQSAGFYNGYLQTDLTLGIENTYLGYQSGAYANTGSKNVALGYQALIGTGLFADNPSNVFYKRNVAIGDSSMAASYGSDNVAVGFKTLSKSQNGGQHVAIGSRALSNTIATYPNTAVGYSSQDSATNGTANTSVGSYSLTKNKQGINNTAIGNYAMNGAENIASPTSMFDNTAVGNGALQVTRYFGQTAVGAGTLGNDTAGIYNTALGYLAMNLHQRGNSNTAVGTSALRLDINGALNTALGVNAMYNHKTGDNNVAVGFNALLNDNDGGANTAVGTSAMVNHKTGGLNSAVGFEVMYSDTSGGLNAAVGYRSMRFVKNGYENTAIGTGSLEFTDSSNYNTAIGRGAMNAKGGKFNTALGYYASGLNSGAASTNYYVNETTSIGYNAGFKNIADQNTFVGSHAGYGASSDSLRGIENTGIGSYSLFFNNNGKSNTAVGLGALYFNTTGSGNVGNGIRALLSNNTGNRNVAIGDSALFFNSSGSSNTGLGYLTSTTNLTNATAIGANALVAQNNSLVLGSINGINGATSDTKVGIGTTTPDSIFSVADNFLVGKSGTVQYDNTVPVMAYMFKSGAANANRMVIAHSTGNANYGLQYQDIFDRFHFLSAGTPVLTVDLGTQRVGVGVSSPTHQLQLSTDDAAKLTTSTWAITSDIRLKKVDGNYTKGLKDILALNTIMYHYAAGNALNLSTKEQGYGFSAQDVQKIFPEAVKTDSEGFLSLNIHPILVAYVNAFKEQQQQIDELKKQMEELKSLIKIKN